MELTQIANSAELVLFGLALYLSKSKSSILLLIVYNFYFQASSWVYTSDLNSLDGVTQFLYDDIVITAYLTDGLASFLFALTSVIMMTRVSNFIAIIMCIQSLISFLMALSTHLYVNYGYDIYYIFDAHSKVQPNFVIIYLVSAWMCVYLARNKMNYGRR